MSSETSGHGAEGKVQSAVIPVVAGSFLPAGQRRSLEALAGAIVPASERHGVPGADDPLIFADVMRVLNAHQGPVLEALGRLDSLADGCFADATGVTREHAIAQFRKQRTPGLTAIQNAVLQAYYRDDRVMVSLGMAPRAPFPQGFEVEQGDWSLLDPVRARASIYREV